MIVSLPCFCIASSPFYNQRLYYRAGVVTEAMDEDMETTWNLTTDTAAGKTITLPLPIGYNYDFIVDWGDGNTAAVTAYNDADRIHEYSSTGTVNVSMSGTVEGWSFNNGGDKLKFISVDSWGGVRMTGDGLVGAFSGCRKATYFADMPSMDGVTSLALAWNGCTSLTNASAVSALTNVTTMAYTWYGCSSLTTASDVSTLTNVTTLAYAWYKCSSLTNAPAVSALTKVTILDATWLLCTSLSTTPELNTLTNVTTMADAFSGCVGLTSASDIDQLGKLTTIKNAWKTCNNLATIPLLPSASTALTTTAGAFHDVNTSLVGTAVELWNTTNFPNITSFTDTFTGAVNLDNYADIPNTWKGL